MRIFNKARIGSTESKKQLKDYETKPESPSNVVVIKVEENKTTEDYKANETEEIPECYIIKYPLILLKICGLHHRKSDHIALKIYGIFLILIDWSNFARSFSTYSASDTLSADLVLKIIFTNWELICAFSATIIFINQEKCGRQDLLMRNILSIFNLKVSSCRQKVLRRHIYIIYGITFMVAILNMAAVLVSFFGPRFWFNGFKLMLAPFHNSDWAADSVPLKLLFFFLTSVTTLHWTLSAAIYLSHAIVVIELLRNYNSKFKDFIKNNIIVSKDSGVLEKWVATNHEENIFIESKEKACVCEDRFEKFRLFHLKLSFLVDLLDKCYREFIGVALLLYTVAILLLLYIMSDWSGNCVNGILAVMYPFWCFSVSGFLLVIVIFAAIIHSLVTI